jgi:hypothetical protein
MTTKATAMSDVVADPLLLGQRVIAILETGQRDATYKLATLMALIDHCIENLPKQAEDVLRVPLPELAHRVLTLYWPQVRPFEGRELRQRRTGAVARIPDAAKSLREATHSGNSGLSLDIAMNRAPSEYQTAIAKITLALAKQPLPRLQKLPGSPVSDPFLYDDSFLGEGVVAPTGGSQQRDHFEARHCLRPCPSGRPVEAGPRDHVAQPIWDVVQMIRSTKWGVQFKVWVQ